jgi:hypothetical protein
MSFLLYCFSGSVVPCRCVIGHWFRNELQKGYVLVCFSRCSNFALVLSARALVSPWLERRVIILAPCHQGQGREGRSGEMNRPRPSASLSGLSLKRCRLEGNQLTGEHCTFRSEPQTLPLRCTILRTQPTIWPYCLPLRTNLTNV